MGRKTGKKARSNQTGGGGSLPPAEPPQQPSPHQSRQPPKKPPLLTHGAAFALLGAAGAVMGNQFGTTWWSQAGALLFVAISLVGLVWFWEGSLHWRSGYKVACSGLILLLGAIFFGPKISAQYTKENAPADDLLANITIPDPKQLLGNEIDFGVNFTNRGSQAVTIKDLGAFVAYTKNGVLHKKHPCDIPDLYAQAVDAWYGEGAVENPGSALGNDDETVYYAMRSTLAASAGDSIEEHKGKTVWAHIKPKGTEGTQYNETFLCPIIRYLDFEGVQHVVVCDGYNFSEGVNSHSYGIEPNTSFRLLPHAATSICKVDEPPKKPSFWGWLT